MFVRSYEGWCDFFRRQKESDLFESRSLQINVHLLIASDTNWYREVFFSFWVKKSEKVEHRVEGGDSFQLCMSWLVVGLPVLVKFWFECGRSWERNILQIKPTLVFKLWLRSTVSLRLEWGKNQRKKTDTKTRTQSTHTLWRRILQDFKQSINSQLFVCSLRVSFSLRSILCDRHCDTWWYNGNRRRWWFFG